MPKSIEHPTKKGIARFRKNAIMRSYSYQTWYQWRMQNPNPPKNPFQAYMIDYSLKAKLKGKEHWKRQVNRADIESSDYPPEGSWRRQRADRPHRRPTYAPRPQEPTISIPKPETVFGPSGLPEEEVARKEYEKMAGILSQKYNLPMPKIIVVPTRGSIGGHMRWRLSGPRGGYGVSASEGQIPEIEVGSKGFLQRPDVFRGLFLHEFGHLAHYGSLLQTQGYVDVDIAIGKDRETKVMRELSANLLKKQFFKDLSAPHTARAKWGERFAIGTYLKQYGVKEIVTGFQSKELKFMPFEELKKFEGEGLMKVDVTSVKVPTMKLGGNILNL